MPKTANPKVKGIIRAYIGMVIKFPDLAYHSQLALRQELIPEDMRATEGLIFQGVLDLKGRIPPIMPTRDNVANWLAVSGKSARIEVLDAIVHEVEEEDASGAPVYASFIEMWMQNVSGIETAQRVAEIMNEPTHNYEDKYQRAAVEFSKAVPKSSLIQTFSEDDLVNLVVRENRATFNENQLTGDIGWGMPFPAHKAAFGRFKEREFTTLIAPTGVGKTTLMDVTSEYQSWVQPIRSDTVKYQLETTPLEQGQRQLSRHLGIPFDAIDTGAVLLDSDQWRPKVEKFKEDRRKLSNDRGHIQVEYMPGATIDQVTLSMEGYAQASLATNRRIAFWLDNLQRFDWTSMGMSQSEAFTFITDRLSFVVRKYPNAHFFLIAQEYDGRVFGSTSIERMSQKMLFLRREAPEGGVQEDMPILTPEKDANGKPTMIAGKPKMIHRRDALGGLRYWHRRGDKFLGKGVIEIAKINSGAARTIEILFEGALNRMEQEPLQLAALQNAGLIPKAK